jgi:hypothetical protein
MSKRFIYYSSFGGVQYFSDLFGMPTAAYALIKLTPTSTNCIRVRRSSDNAEQDIGFVANVPNSPIDTTALLSFVGAGNGFIATKYDQSTNNNHATNSTGSTQPQIVSSGSLITESGLPSYSVTGKLLQMPAGMITGSSARASFSVVKASSANAVVGGNTTYGLLATAPSTGQAWNVSIETSALFVRVIGNASFSYPSGKSSTDYSLISTIFNQTTVNQVLNWQNGVTMPFASGTGATINTLGTVNGRIAEYTIVLGNTFTGNHLAHILYNTDKASQRAAIETYLDNYYNVL